jgi:hypothetical protein
MSITHHLPKPAAPWVTQSVEDILNHYQTRGLEHYDPPSHFVTIEVRAWSDLYEVVVHREGVTKRDYAYCRHETAVEAAKRLAAGFNICRGYSARVLP